MIGRRFFVAGRISVSTLALAAAGSAWPTLARADASLAEECIAAAEQSQPLRHDGKLRAAHQKLLACSRAECPAVIRADCTKWLADLDDAMPTIVVSAVDSAGADVADVRVSLDGDLLLTRLEGKEIPIDPGSHALRFEREGSDPIEQQVVIREGERHRVVTITFAPRPGAATTAATPLPSTPPEEEHPGESRRSLVLPIALIGAGAAGIAVASYFWVSGLGDHSNMASECAPTHSCSQSAVDSARGKLVAGDIVGGLGIVGAGIGAGLLLFGRPGTQAAPSGSASIGVRPVAGGAAVDLTGRF
jgi:hypothetical protein